MQSDGYVIDLQVLLLGCSYLPVNSLFHLWTRCKSFDSKLDSEECACNFVGISVSLSNVVGHVLRVLQWAHGFFSQDMLKSCRHGSVGLWKGPNRCGARQRNMWASLRLLGCNPQLAHYLWERTRLSSFYSSLKDHKAVKNFPASLWSAFCQEVIQNFIWYH